jgi:hypothetical protein
MTEHDEKRLADIRVIMSGCAYYVGHGVALVYEFLLRLLDAARLENAELMLAGDEAQAALAAARERVAKLERLLRALWTSDMIDFDGITVELAAEIDAALTPPQGNPMSESDEAVRPLLETLIATARRQIDAGAGWVTVPAHEHLQFLEHMQRLLSERTAELESARKQNDRIRKAVQVFEAVNLDFGIYPGPRDSDGGPSGDFKEGWNAACKQAHAAIGRLLYEVMGREGIAPLSSDSVYDEIEALLIEAQRQRDEARAALIEIINITSGDDRTLVEEAIAAAARKGLRNSEPTSEAPAVPALAGKDQFLSNPGLGR